MVRLTTDVFRILNMYVVGCTIFQSIHEVDTFIVHCQLSIVHCPTYLRPPDRPVGLWKLPGPGPGFGL